MYTSSLVHVPIINGKKNPKVFLTRSENEEDVTNFSVTPCVMVLLADDPAPAAFSFERLDTSDISSQSREPVEVAKSWPCSTGVNLLVNLLFHFSSVPHPAWFSSRAGWISTSSIARFPPGLFHSLFQPFRRNFVPFLVPSSFGPFLTIGFLCFFGIHFLEISLILVNWTCLDTSTTLIAFYHFYCLITD